MNIKLKINKFLMYLAEVKKDFKTIKFITPKQTIHLSIVTLVITVVTSGVVFLLDILIKLILRFTIGV